MSFHEVKTKKKTKPFKRTHSFNRFMVVCCFIHYKQILVYRRAFTKWANDKIPHELTHFHCQLVSSSRLLNNVSTRNFISLNLNLIFKKISIWQKNLNKSKFYQNDTKTARLKYRKLSFFVKIVRVWFLLKKKNSHD